MKVSYTNHFLNILDKLSDDDLTKIATFVKHIEAYGLVGLIGRNKSSDNVPRHKYTWLDDVRFAQQHHLWHYHIGIPEYVGEYGDCTSKYVLHYQRYDDYIVLVDLDYHPPFRLPTLNTLK
ncbi:hypothetical protein LU293_09605 [Moraxella nasovis]|uniref:hypothetical protein n=1 Tax=Moraxella nasovis TaxID=2904121 RepID=UPI001F6214E9|nr:hypothetical protein [Moraxella nasovis]UNU73302.1 hypothetical protein LU293_09605 [Moraxella nasovis]